MDKHSLSGEMPASNESEFEPSSELAGMSLSQLLHEMSRMQAEMLPDGENIERDTDPAMPREARLQEIYEALKTRGVKVTREGDIDLESIEVEKVRTEVERWLAKQEDFESESDEAA